MRKTVTIFLILLFFFCSCDKRKSTEEGAVFLREVKYGIGTGREYTEVVKSLIEAEAKYNFTTEQLLNLKFLQLSTMSSALSKDRIMALGDQIEQLAVKTGNDSILIRSKAFIFSTMSFRFFDPVVLTKLLERDEPLLLEKKQWNELRNYYLGISLSYKRHLNYDMAVYYTLKLRPYAINRISWYINIGESMLEVGRNLEAITYADSIFMAYDASLSPVNRQQKQIQITQESLGYSIKCRALQALGKTESALALYKIAEDNIEQGRENFEKIRLQRGMSDTSTYSAGNVCTLYDYAVLLKQAGKINEAVRVLEKISFFIQYDNGADSNKQTFTEVSINIPRLLSECYSLLKNNERSVYYTARADSIMIDIRRREVERAVKSNSQELTNLQLTDTLSQKMLQVKRANVVQYIMVLVIGVLLALIVVGWLWWRERNRRLQRLFDQMIYRHAAWAALHLPVGESVERECDVRLLLKHGGVSGKENQAEKENGATSDSAQPLHYPVMYRRLNQIMRERAFFLDPNFEMGTLAMEAGISRTLLSNVLNRHAGMNFKDWLAEYRVNYLLEQVKMSPDIEIGDLYLQAGFTSRATFFRQFRNVTGLTPRQYLSRMGSNQVME